MISISANDNVLIYERRIEYYETLGFS